MDSIRAAGITLDTYHVDGRDVIMTFRDTLGTVLSESDVSLTVLNGKDKVITIGTDTTIFTDPTEKIFAKTDTTPLYSAGDIEVKLIDASKKTSPIYIIGHTFSDTTVSTIKGGTKADTIQGGKSNDILTGGKGNDRFIFSGGNDTITDYTAGQDSIIFSDVNLISSTYDSNNLVFNTSSGTLTIQNAIKKKKDQKITIIEGDVITSQIYGRTSLTVGASDGDTVDLSRTINSEVTVVNAGGRGAKYPLTIIGNDNADSLTGSKGNDTIILSTDTARAKATITYTAGNDVITNWHADDIIALSKGQSFATATKKTDTNFTITVNKKKKAVGTLDIFGAFTTTADSSTTYVGTGADSVNSYCDVTSYVSIGEKKITYNIETKVKVTSAAYMEHNYNEDVFADTVLVDYADTDDLSAITNITNSPNDKAVIFIDPAPTFNRDYNDLKDNVTTLAKTKNKS